MGFNLVKLMPQMDGGLIGEDKKDKMRKFGHLLHAPGGEITLPLCHERGKNYG